VNDREIEGYDALEIRRWPILTIGLYEGTESIGTVARQAEVTEL
jgi:hypothetical protein